MKYITTILLLTISSVSYAQEWDITPYIEYKNVQGWVDDDYKGDVNHLRFGTKIGKVYAEIGGTSSDKGDGFSAEAGYKWKFTEKWTIKGKWEGVDNNDNLAHKLETELRFTF